MNASPRILRCEWGRLEIEGLGSGKDMKLWPGGGREWDWSETGTRHVPGIQVADVEELLDHGSEVVVLSRGVRLALQTRTETLDLLRAKGITHYTVETNEAVRLYNELVEEGKRVGGLFHSTC